MASYPAYNGYQSPYNQSIPYMQPQYSMQQTRGSGIEVVYATEAEATTHLVDAGKKMLFIITDKPMMIFKATDMLGFSTIERYKTEKVSENTTDDKTLENDIKNCVKLEDLKGYLKVEDLETINKRLHNIESRIFNNHKEVNNGQSV